MLGWLVLVLSTRIGKSVLLYFNSGLSKIYLQVGLSACFFIGPFLYFYLKSKINNIDILPKSWKWTLYGFLTFIIGIGIIKPYPVYPEFWNGVVIHLIYWQWLGFVAVSGFLLRKVIIKFIRPQDLLLPAERWLLAIYIANVVIFSAFFLALYGASSAYYITGPLVFSFFLYLAFFGYFYTNKQEFSEQKELKKYVNKKIELDEASQLALQLENLMTEKELYKKPKLKLKTVAEELAISPHLLSQFLNDNLGKSFSIYINEYRIHTACHLLTTANHLSLEGIGYEVGFLSKSTFFTNFKKIKGVTPARYQQQMKEKRSI